MKLAMIGVGQAGGKLLDAFLARDKQAGTNIVRAAVAVNTAESDLSGLEHVPEENRLLIGQTRVSGHGVGADNELGAEIAKEDANEFQNALDDVPVHAVDAFLILAGLGGGTGSGAGPVLAQEIKRIYTEPVYGLGALPGGDEGSLYTLNAARSFRTFVREVDNLLLIDNDAWRQSGQSMQGAFENINAELVRRLGVLFAAGEVDNDDVVAESIVDSSEIINTLEGGGVSSVGFASVTIEEIESQGLMERLGFGEDDGIDSADAINRATSLVRRATLGRLTLPCQLEGVQRALVVLAGPPDYLSRKGVEQGRKWLEQETGSMEVRGGDYPLPGEAHIACVVLLSGITDAPRITRLQEQAVEAQETIAESEELSEERIEELVTDEDDELSELF